MLFATWYQNYFPSVYVMFVHCNLIILNLSDFFFYHWVVCILITSHLLPITRHLLPVTCHPLAITHHSPPATCHLPSVEKWCWLLTLQIGFLCIHCPHISSLLKQWPAWTSAAFRNNLLSFWLQACWYRTYWPKSDSCCLPKHCKIYLILELGCPCSTWTYNFVYP